MSRSDLDAAESEDRQARAQVTVSEADIVSAEARVHEAEVNLAYTDIVSPVDGVVVSRNVAVGQTVAASFQTPTLFLVAGDLTRMAVIASVSESDIGGVRTGQNATFTVDAYPNRAFEGHVGEVRNAPVTVQNVVTYEVVVKAENADLHRERTERAPRRLECAALPSGDGPARARGRGVGGAAPSRPARVDARCDRDAGTRRGHHRRSGRPLHGDHERAQRGRPGGDRGASAARGGCVRVAVLRAAAPQRAMT
jgi:hypothetical protein